MHNNLPIRFLSSNVISISTTALNRLYEAIVLRQNVTEDQLRMINDLHAGKRSSLSFRLSFNVHVYSLKSCLLVTRPRNDHIVKLYPLDKQYSDRLGSFPPTIISGSLFKKNIIDNYGITYTSDSLQRFCKRMMVVPDNQLRPVFINDTVVCRNVFGGFTLMPIKQYTG